ncbi:MAG: hypothetical protein H6821_07155 [Planctomycetaceae bacterium]|nr:hypothetical protein [Planctomycetaceae bacterium]
MRCKDTKRCFKIRLPIVVVLLTAASTSLAGSGSVVSLPLPGKKVTTGLNLEINTEWVDGNGYRPVTISISPLGGGAAPADRTLDVTLRPRSHQWGVVMPNVSTTVILEQGQTVGTKIVALPQFQSIGYIEVVTYEDGRLREDLSENAGMAWNSVSGWSEAAPTMLFIDSDAPAGGRSKRLATAMASPNKKKDKKPEHLPDIRPLAALFTPQTNGANIAVAGLDPSEDIDDRGLLNLANFFNRIDFLHPDQLPTEWVHLTSVDVIFISMLDLQALKARPEKWEPLRTWLSSGTTLCVYGLGEEFRSIRELGRLFDFESSDASDDVGFSITEPQELGWSLPAAGGYDDEVHAARGVEWSNNQWYGQPQVAVARPRTNNSTLKPDRPMPFVLRGVDHGFLVAFSDDNPFPGKREEWCWLFNTLSNQDWMWYQRHGLSFHRENPQYWNLLIPGVGDAPVTSFLVLISLFVVVIGPINYFILHRRRKLFLLLLTVPLGAGVITTALFTYALVNDGLGVRVRARSLTRIDQTNGRTVSWSRQSYYAGLAPSAGMSFPLDAAVYPIDHRPTGRYGQPKDLGRQLRWSSTQRLTRGYLNSRSTAQVMVIESRETNLGIEVDETGGIATTPRVTNQLGVDIEQLLIRSADGRSLACGKLPAGSSVQLHAVNLEEYPENWSKLFATERPQYPIGFDPNQVENASAIFGDSYAYWQQIDRGLPEPTTATSVLERGLRDIGNIKLNEMKSRSYVAIVRNAPNVSLGVDSVDEEASFHVVTGSW